MELGQMFSSNTTAGLDCPEFVIRDLVTLSELIDPTDMGYGTEFSNDVFEMNPYYWGDCTCDFDEKEAVWDETNDHRDDCYIKVRLRRLVDAGLDDATWDDPDEQRITKELCEEMGLSYPEGSMVHCTCDFYTTWHEWLKENKHSTDCGVAKPNFHFKPAGLKVYWYKYIGRSTTINQEVDLKDWRLMMRECEDSLS